MFTRSTSAPTNAPGRPSQGAIPDTKKTPLTAQYESGEIDDSCWEVGVHNSGSHASSSEDDIVYYENKSLSDEDVVYYKTKGLDSEEEEQQEEPEKEQKKRTPEDTPTRDVRLGSRAAVRSDLSALVQSHKLLPTTDLRGSKNTVPIATDLRLVFVGLFVGCGLFFVVCWFVC